jgi:signal peptidase I
MSGPQRQHGIVHYVGLGISIGVLGLILLLALVVIVVPKIAGATPMTILTSSMEPTLPPGTLIVVKPTPINKIGIGDVLTYQIRSGDPAVVSHRVIGVSSVSDGTFTFVTKGDNNDQADPAVIEAQVKGTVWYSVPWLGYVNNAVGGQERSWIVPVIAVLLLAYAGYLVTSGTISSVRRRTREEASADDVDRVPDTVHD